MSFRETVLQETNSLFLKKGIRSLAMDDILQTLNISKSTMFGIAPDKETLVALCLEQLLEAGHNQVLTIIEKNGNPVASLLHLLHAKVTELGSASPQFFYDLEQDYNVTWKSYSQNQEDITYMAVKQLVTKAIDGGYLQPNLNTELISRLLVAQLYCLLPSSSFSRHRFTPAEVYESVFVQYVKGLCTAQGLEAVLEEVY